MFEARSRFNVRLSTPVHKVPGFSWRPLAPFTMEAYLERFRTSNTQQWALMSPYSVYSGNFPVYDATRKPTNSMQDGQNFHPVTVR